MASAGGPSASFVLGLEEQLRTDLRLGPARSQSPRTLRWLAAVAGLMAVVGAVVVARSQPGDFAYGIKSRLEATILGDTPEQPAGAVAFEQGRRRLEEVARAVHDDHTSRPTLDALLAEVLRLYSEGTVAAATSQDRHALDRARLEVRAAEVELLRLGDGAEPGRREALAETRAALERLRGPVAANPIVASSTPERPSATLQPPASPTADPGSHPPSATATAKPVPPATGTPAASITPTVSPTPSTLPPSTVISPPTKPPRESQPTLTPLPTPETSRTPAVIPPTPTRDLWPTDTPEPVGPIAPGTAGPPSATPPAS